MKNMLNNSRKLDEEHKRKLSEAHKGKHYSPKTEFKKGHRLSEETKRKMSKAKKGCKRPDMIAINKLKSITQKGENNPNWQGGISFEPYTTDWTKTLRRSIRERDFYTCQICKEP